MSIPYVPQSQGIRSALVATKLERYATPPPKFPTITLDSFTIPST